MSDVLTVQMIRDCCAALRENARPETFTIVCRPKDLWRFKLMDDDRIGAAKAAWRFRYLYDDDETMYILSSILRGSEFRF